MSDAGRAAVAAVDWGTSSLRVWLMDAEGAVLSERRSGEGMQAARQLGFSLVLERLLAEMRAPAALPAIVCGMAGARQGWVEAPYAEVPNTVEDIFGQAAGVPDAARPVRIVPGLAQRLAGRPDVMRGEETQIAGALSRLGGGHHVLCMPGTHSKWVAVADGTVTDFTTWMTGELFNVLAAQTILAHSIADAAGSVSAASPAFAAGLRQGLDDADLLSSALFGIRAASLLEGLPPADAAARLSGLLLGTEIAGARGRYPEAGGELVLVAAGGLQKLYLAALEQAGLPVRTIDADEAVRAGLLRAARVNGMLPEGS